jgi:hypothetical protein
MEWNSWGSDGSDQAEQRRRFEEEAMEWARIRLVNEARGRGQSSSQLNMVMGMIAGGGASFDVTTTTSTTTQAQPTTTTTTAEPTTTTTTTGEPTTTTTTTEDPNWVQLIFTDWTYVDANIGNRTSVGDWNSYLIAASASQFSSVSVNSETFTVKLYGGSEITLTDSAFAGSDLVSISDNSSVAIFGVGTQTFSQCTSLTVVQIGGTTFLGASCFEGCTAMTSFSFPAVTSVGALVFQDCSSATTFDLPNLTDASEGFFSGCTAATSILLPSCSLLGPGDNQYNSNTNDGVFDGITGNTITVTLATVPTTATGAYEEDLLGLISNNTVTLNGSEPVWIEMDSAVFARSPKVAVTQDGTSYTNSLSPSVSAIGFVYNTTGWATTSDSVSNPELPTIPGGFTAEVVDPAIGTYYFRAYVTTSLGTFYSPTQVEVAVQPFDLTLSRQTTTDISDPPNYINGEPVANSPSNSDGEVYFNILADGNIDDVTEAGIVSSTSPSPILDGFQQTGPIGDGFTYIVPEPGNRYYRAYATVSNLDTYYSPEPGVQFRMEEIDFSLVATPVGSPPNTGAQFDLTASITSPGGTISSAGFSWNSPLFAEIQEDPYYVAEDSTTVSVTNNEWTHSVQIYQTDGTFIVRAWIVVNGVKYWSQRVESTFF